ncbi:MAG: cytochrome D ubiquinol oxidase subunit I, partial [Ferrovum sp.]|nr:cytochrome D ubiquinol oxidase subunit I [Ferrovum sp.]
GTVVGLLAEMMAAGLNANLGGREQIPVEVERQVAGWAREWFGFPETARGVFTTGTSQATLMAIWVARVGALGDSVRTQGLRTQELRAYAATTAHGSVAKAMDLAGLGSDALCLVPVDENYRMDLQALRQAIATDREAGARPFLVVGSAGTVDTGSIDDLEGLGRLCREFSLWFHVDGALGALGCWSSELAPKFSGMDQADSIAFDFHKWGQVPYDAGFLLVRDGDRQRRTFVAPTHYLGHEKRGAAAGEEWPCDFGPDLSRGFRALKTWWTVRHFGTRRLGAMMANTCALAVTLARQIESEPLLELMAPVSLNIVCFRYRAAPGFVDTLNAHIAMAVQESGIALPSTTILGGRRVLRVALVNHRTTEKDLTALLSAVVHLGQRFSRHRPARQAMDFI